MRGVAFLACTLLALAACGPVYETDYRLETPDQTDEATTGCLSACAAERGSCGRAAEQELRLCEDRASLQEQACETRAQLDFMVCSAGAERDGTSCYRRQCRRPSCSTGGLGACEASYRRCFAACGGKVLEERRCVANCPS